MSLNILEPLSPKKTPKDIAENCNHESRVRVVWLVDGKSYRLCRMCVKKIRLFNSLGE